VAEWQTYWESSQTCGLLIHRGSEQGESVVEMVGTLGGLDAKYGYTEGVVRCCRGWPRAFERLYQWGYEVDVVVEMERRI